MKYYNRLRSTVRLEFSRKCKWTFVSLLLVAGVNLTIFKQVRLYALWGSKNVFPSCRIGDSNDFKIAGELKINIVASKESGVFEEIKNIKQSVSNVFFVETTCVTRKAYNKFDTTRVHLKMSPRQCCAVESMALTNPNRRIFILYTCPISVDIKRNLPKYARGLFNLPNVRVVRLNLGEMFDQTPFQKLYVNGIVETSPFLLEHFSDLIRMAVLWRFGGTYCDLDFVIIKCLNDLGTNFAGSEDNSSINSAIMNVDPEGFGHSLVESVMELISYGYNPQLWSWNGPVALTKTVLDYCRAREVDEAIETCEKFRIYKSHIFYPVHWAAVEGLFNNRLGKDVVEFAENFSFGVHMWNKLSRAGEVLVGGTQAYGLLAQRYCPEVYWNSEGVF